MSSEDFKKIAKVSDITEGQIIAVELGRELIVLSKLEGEIYAINEMCGHSNGPLGDGFIDGDQIECPWHGSRFCLTTGEVTQGPATESVARYAVRVEGDDIYLGPVIT
jgi:nitrite reductase/ring-hydroxylating ferredoxin subunit